MPDETFEARCALPVSAADAFAWHARTGAFQRLQPPWERVEVKEQIGGIEDGAQVRLRVGVGPAWTSWTMRHEGYVEGERFVDRQESGPFAIWRHEHLFEADGAERSHLVDRVSYKLPLGWLGRVLGGGLTRRKLERMFCYRHAITGADLAQWRLTNHVPRMKILVSGATGLVGSSLCPFLTTQGHEVLRLSRSKEGGDVRWSPSENWIDAKALDGVDAVVHLSGANIASGRWTEERKKAILRSRLDGTRLLVETMRGMAKPPSVFVSSSAVGFYGDTGDNVVDESAPGGSGFLADVCRRWEAEAMRAGESGVRTVLVRTGLVMTPEGGVLKKLLPVFKAGLGGPVGDGRQWMSWVSIDDLTGIFLHAIGDDSLRGPVNAVAPNAVTNREFARVLGDVLGRPAVMRAPASVLKLALGQMARETVLASTRATPGRLEASSYVFRHRTLEAALRRVLGKE